jgi:hypothetical protein
MEIQIEIRPHVHAVEQLDAGAYGYLVSRTALVHPKGETFDVSMGLRGLFDALTKIAAQPEKDFGELVRRRRRKRGLPVAPAGKVLPFLPDRMRDDPALLEMVDAAAGIALRDDLPPDQLRVARLRLAERRLREALFALDDASVRGASAREYLRLEQVFFQTVANYEALAALSAGGAEANEN